MSAASFLLIFIAFVVSLLLLPLLAFAFVRKYGTGWRLFFAVVALQGLLITALLYPVLANFPSAAAIILPGILAAYAAFAALVGLVSYAVLFFLTYRPKNWQRYSLWLTGISAIAIAVYVVPILISKSGITTNVDLHGIVLDIDGELVPNVEVKFKNCDYMRESAVFTDAQGRFQAVANCSSYFIIESIRNHTTATDCQSSFPGTSKHGLIVFDSLERTPDSDLNPSWPNHTADNPVSITCVWHVPDTVQEYMDTHNTFPNDGSIITVAPATRRSRLDFVGGEHEGLFRLEFVADTNDSTESPALVTGRLRITPVAGGIQVTSDYKPYNAAPKDSYQPYAEIELDDITKSADERFYFHSNDQQVYGALRVSVDYSYSFKTREYKPPLNLRVEVFTNDAGSRVLLTHKIPYSN